jgi:hypothetical protein
VNTVPGLEFNQSFIFCATYELAEQARVLLKTRLERLASGKHSNVLGLFVSYDENEVLFG